jgi:hypothetical protein
MASGNFPRKAAFPFEGDFYFEVVDGDVVYVGKYWLDPRDRFIATLENVYRVDGPGGRR